MSSNNNAARNARRAEMVAEKIAEALASEEKQLILRAKGLKVLPPIPEGIVILVCDYNYLTQLPPLPSTLRYLSCSNNRLTSLPPLPDRIQYINCSANPSLTLPRKLPTYLQELYATSIPLTTIPLFSRYTNKIDIDSRALVPPYKNMYVDYHPSPIYWGNIDLLRARVTAFIRREREIQQARRSTKVLNILSKRPDSNLTTGRALPANVFGTIGSFLSGNQAHSLEGQLGTIQEQLKTLRETPPVPENIPTTAAPKPIPQPTVKPAQTFRQRFYAEAQAEHPQGGGTRRRRSRRSRLQKTRRSRD